MALIATKEFDSRPFQLLLKDSELIILANPQSDPDSNTGIYYQNGYYSGGGGHIAAESSAEPYRQGNYVSYNHNAVMVMTYDVTDPANPVEKSKYLLDGSYKSSRRIGSAVRVILTSYPYYPVKLKYFSPWANENETLSLDQKAAAMRANLDENIQAIKNITIEDWLRLDQFAKINSENVKTSIADLAECKNIHAPTVSAQLGLTRVATLNLEADSITESILLARVDETYASQESLYLTTRYWWWNNEARDTDFTFIHKFALQDPEYAHYQGSGGVEGHLLNQFSLDEYEQNLRVATTINRRIPSQENVWAGWEQSNKVSVLAQQESGLEVIGETEEIAKDERIYSARFKGDKGYIVTFRQTDPLFTLDLSNPEKPAVVGELKIPGFSSYIHIIDDSHLLTIGREGTETGRILGLKISIFDVSDMANPTEVQKYVLDGNFWSEAQYDHKAFTYFPARKLLGIPATGYRATSVGQNWWSRYRSTLMVFNIDPAEGITQKGEVDMTDIYTSTERQWGWWASAARVSRSIFADDYVYAISNLGIRAAKVEDLTNSVSTARYECDESCFNSWYWYY